MTRSSQQSTLVSSPPRYLRSPRPPSLYPLLFLAAFISACTGTLPSQDPTPAKTCEYGVLNETTQECENKSECHEQKDCKEDYKCHTDNKCYEKDYCADDSREWCAPAEQCVENKCVALKRCSEHSECANDEYCNTLFCLKNTTACSKLDCSRGGVCDPRRSVEHCVNTNSDDSCDNDQQCAGSNYCDLFATPKKCKENKCGQDNLCTSGGTCDPSVGPDAVEYCKNKPICNKQQDCKKGYMCVFKEGEEGKCEPEENLCATACSGNQVCHCNGDEGIGRTCERSTKEKKQLLTCAENLPAGCRNKYDCLGTRVCKENAQGGASCAAPPGTCTDDTLAKHKYDQATPYEEVRFKELVLCNEPDFIKFESSNTGKLIVKVEIDSLDVGNKDVEVKVYTGSNESLKQEIFNSHTEQKDPGYYVFTQDITDNNSSPYTIEVKGGEGAPLHYKLHVTLASDAVYNACFNDAKSVEFEGPLSKKYPYMPDSYEFTGRGEGLTTETSELVPSCTNSNTGKDIWKFELKDRSYVTVTARGEEEVDTAVAIRSSCEINNDIVCRNDAAASQSEEAGALLDPGTYYAIIEASSSPSQRSGKYNLTITAQEASCRAENRSCSNNPFGAPSTYTYCDEKGQTRTVTCPQGKTCTADNKRCEENEGDSCATAIRVDKATPQQGSFAPERFSNTFEPGKTCLGGLSPELSKGRDRVFQVVVPGGHRVIAEARADEAKTSIYLSETCKFDKDTSRCLQKASSEKKGESTLFTYKNKTEKEATYYLVIDNDTTLASKISRLEYQVRVVPDPICDPNGKPMCASGRRESRSCNKFGTALDIIQDCYGRGCDDTTGKCKPPVEDVCSSSTTPLVPRSSSSTPSVYRATGVLRQVKSTNDYPDACGDIPPFFGYAPPKAPDLIYRIDATAGTSYHVEVKPLASDSFVPQIWLSDTCNNLGENTSCLDGVQGEELSFYAKETKSYWVVVESASDVAHEGGAFEIIVTSSMNNGEKPFTLKQCEINTGKVILYNHAGQQEEIICPGGCENNENGEGRCKNGTGDSCVQAKKLYANGDPTSGRVQATEYTNYTRYMPAFKKEDQIDQCNFGNFHPQGRDVFYQFDLKEGDVVNVEIEHQYTNGIAFFQKGGTCGDPSSCTGTTYGVLHNDQLAYKATEDETVTLVIKRIDQSVYGTFSFDWTVYPKATAPKTCAPNVSRCESDKLYVCDNDGNTEKEYDCTSSCSGSLCVPQTLTSTSPSCGGKDVIVFNDHNTARKKGTFLLPSKKGASSQLTSSCLPSDGPEYIFQVHADNNDVISVTATSLSENKPSVYILDACNDSTCTGAQGSQYYIFPTTYKKQVKQSSTKTDNIYYVVIDTEEKDKDIGPFVVTLEVGEKSSDCDTNPDPKCNSLANTIISYCNEEGLPFEYACGSAGCHETNDGKALCNSKNPGVSCFEPILLDHTAKRGTEDSKRLITSTSTDKVKVENDINNSCLLPEKHLIGQEAWYAIHLDEGDTFIGTVKQPWGETDKLSFFITQDCGGEQQCLAASPSILGNHTITYRAPKGGTYFVVVDSRDKNLTSPYYTLEWEVKKGEPRYKHSGYCDDSDPKKLYYVSSEQEVIEVTCADGCKGGTCAIDTSSSPQAQKKIANINECNAAKDADAIIKPVKDKAKQAYAVTLPMRRFQSAIGLNHGDITSSRKADAIYKVKLTPGATVRAYVGVSSAKERTIIYILDSLEKCDNAEKGFLAGSRFDNLSEGINGPVYYKYETTTDKQKDVYVVLDAATLDGGYVADFPKHLFLEVDYPDCTYGKTASKCNGDSVTYCAPNNIKSTYECKGTGTPKCEEVDGVGACTQPTHDFCYDTSRTTLAETNTEASPLSITGTLENMTNSHALEPLNSCTKEKAKGPDVVYSVTIPAGKTMHVSVKSTSSTTPDDLALYVSTDCYNVPNTCVAGSDTHTAWKSATEVADPETTKYTNSGAEDQTVYVHVGSRDTGNSTFDLKLWLE